MGDLDRAFLDREVGERTVTDENETDDINVARTIDAIHDADAVAAPEEVAEVVRTMEDPRLTFVDESGSEEAVINLFGPVEVPQSAKPEPRARPKPEPARAALEPRTFAGSWAATYPSSARQSGSSMMRLGSTSLGKCLSFFVWSNTKDNGKAPKVIFRKEDLSVDFEDFMEAMKKVYRSITVAKVADVAKIGTNNRFEILASPDESLGLRFRRIRAIQGHWRIVMTNDTDLRTTHQTAWVLDDQWDGKLSTQAFPGPYGYVHREFDLIPKLGYHLTYRQCCAGLLTHGLNFGGLNIDQSRGFVMMSPFPAWQREGNEGVRPGAQIEIVIDLQLYCLEGGRLFQTQSGALQTPDRINNRHFVYAFHRHSGHPIWANPYPEVRSPLENALTAYRTERESRLPIFF